MRRRLLRRPAFKHSRFHPTQVVQLWRRPCGRLVLALPLGSSVIPGVRDCPIAGQNLPLIVVSHGFGGSYLGHRDTAETLADAGFIVVAINHPDDAYTNEARFRDYWALISRPSDVRRLIDFLLGPASGPARIDPNRIGFFGFSRGAILASCSAVASRIFALGSRLALVPMRRGARMEAWTSGQFTAWFMTLGSRLSL